MSLRVITSTERPPSEDDWEAVVHQVWAEFLFHEPTVNEYFGRLKEYFPGYQVKLLENDRVVAIGNTIPFAWDGAVEGLPDGVRGVLPLGVRGFVDGVAPTTLCALQIIVRPDCQGRGFSSHVLRAMIGIAASHGLDGLVAPVRPTFKDRYPVTSMESYVRWTRPDGLPLDPWLRVHHRLGAEHLGIAAGSMIIVGTVGEWQQWTGLAFPESGDYVVPGALVPVQIDCERDEGRYVEPNVWMLHPIGGSE